MGKNVGQRQGAVGLVPMAVRRTGGRKSFRRGFSRFDQYTGHFLASIHFACTLLWLI